MAAAATEPAIAQQLEDVDEGPEIRRQVEYYFSDENLPTDLFLLQNCGGRENLPVSIGRIHGFAKMRRFKPKSKVVAALRKSTFLVVTDDGKKVKRKVPLRGPCALDPNFYTDDEIAYDPKARVPVELSLGQPVKLISQEKKVYPPGMTKNMMKATGFEKNYAEPPITPEEAKIEESMYDPDKPFVERIELAIQRFKMKRRMHEMYANIFNKFMRFGGVEQSPNMFQGLSENDKKTMDAEQITRALATHTVPWDRNDRKHWVVDFVGVAEAFLSSFFPAHYGFKPEQIKTACQVLRSFYNYLLFHRVCPEHRDALTLALTLCATAEAELPRVYAAGLALPGAFNTAASTLAGGSKAGTYTGNMAWAMELKRSGMDLGEVGVMDEEARVTFRTGVAVMGDDEQQKLMEEESLKVLADESFGLEILALTPPDALTKEIYARQNAAMAPKLRLEPLGKMTARSWHVDDFNEWDLPKARYPKGSVPKAGVGREYVFWVEERVLEQCFVGMNIEARILTLEGGVTVLDDVHEAFCSFYRWLPNELWMSRKPKEVVVRDRVADRDVAEGEGDGEGGLDDEFDDEEEDEGEKGPQW